MSDKMPDVSPTDGPVRWEYVDVTYTEAVTRVTRVTVRAATPLTAELLDANADYLVSLAVSTENRGYLAEARRTFVGAHSVGFEVAGSTGADTPEGTTTP